MSLSLGFVGESGNGFEIGEEEEDEDDDDDDEDDEEEEEEEDEEDEDEDSDSVPLRLFFGGAVKPNSDISFLFRAKEKQKERERERERGREFLEIKGCCFKKKVWKGQRKNIAVYVVKKVVRQRFYDNNNGKANRQTIILHI